MAEAAQQFLKDKLLPDLASARQYRDELATSLKELDELTQTLAILKDRHDSGEKYKQLVDLGEEHFVKAEADSTEFIFLKVGLGFFLQVTPEEARPIMTRQREALEKCDLFIGSVHVEVLRLD